MATLSSDPVIEAWKQAKQTFWESNSHLYEEQRIALWSLKESEVLGSLIGNSLVQPAPHVPRSLIQTKSIHAQVNVSLRLISMPDRC